MNLDKYRTNFERPKGYRVPWDDRKVPEGIILWVDDVRPPGAWWYTHWARTAEEAIEILASGQVVICSMDHDLGEGQTGYDVAKWIEEHAHTGTLPPIKECHIHSQNPVGQRNIEMALDSARRAWRAR